MDLETPKLIWDKLQGEFEGSSRVKTVRILVLKREFELMKMKYAESVKEFSGRLMDVVNRMRLLGKVIEDQKVVEKMMVSLPQKFEAKISAIEESCDLNTLSIAELTSKLLVQKQRVLMRDEEVMEGAFQASTMGRNSGNMQRRNHLKSIQWKTEMTADEPTMLRRIVGTKTNLLSNQVNVTEEENEEDEHLFMASQDINTHGEKPHDQHAIFFDESVQPRIKLGNGDVVQAKWKGTIAVNTKRGTKFVHNVLYIPELNQNLLSVAQMLKNGYEVSFKGKTCLISDRYGTKLARVEMNGNSFYLKLDVIEGNAISVMTDESVLWHNHVNLNSLKVMHNSGMINDGDQFCKRLQMCDKDGKIRDGLKDVFTDHEEIDSAVMMRDSEEKSKCFEIVNFEKAEDAAETVKILNGKEINAEECYVREWYMKTGGATCEGNPDGDVGQNRADISLVHHDLKTKIIPVASLEFLKMKLGLPKANLKEEC
uniref:RRM domain-containing protein n=1 Tax=Salix viminalis TaxID=40686 RepID=A0A6N2LLD4_SALVM